VNITAPIHQRLATDPELVELLDTYEGQPAVFTDDRIPSGFPVDRFHVVSPGNVADEPWDTKTHQGRRPTRDLIVYGPHRSTRQIEQIAERVRALFHRHSLEVDGHRTVVARCSGPYRMSSDDYDARIVTLRLSLTKETNDG
jgi:hypothetical protein